MRNQPHIVATACVGFGLLTQLWSSAAAEQLPDWASPSIIGGAGGDPASTICPKGAFLRGFNARVGDDIDQVAAICAIPPGRSIGSPLALTADPGEGLMGGSGGEGTGMLCPEVAPFVRHISFAVEGAREQTMVLNRLSIACGPLEGPLPRMVDGYNRFSLSGPTFHGGDGVFVSNVEGDSTESDCPDGMIPIGLHGRAGLVVDAVGVVCRAVVGGVNSLPDSQILVDGGDISGEARTVSPTQATTRAPAAGIATATPAPKALGKALGGGPAPKTPGEILCTPGYGPRRAGPEDNVCVTPDAQRRVQLENAEAADRIDPNGAYGPNTCISGYVWRAAFDGDVVCVTPPARDLARRENALAEQFRRK